MYVYFNINKQYFNIFISNKKILFTYTPYKYTKDI